MKITKDDIGMLTLLGMVFFWIAWFWNWGFPENMMISMVFSYATIYVISEVWGVNLNRDIFSG